MIERLDWRDEISRQKARLEEDMVSRHLGVLLACILFFTFLPFWLVFFVYISIILSELKLRQAMHNCVTQQSKSARRAMMFWSALGLFLFVLPAVVVWFDDSAELQFYGSFAIFAAFLNVSVVRSTHLPFGLVSAIPPALALICLPLASLAFDGVTLKGVVSSVASLAMIGYFLSALVNNHRMERRLLSAMDRVREVNEAKTRFLAAMNHEVRTPLNAILGEAQILRERCPQGDAAGHVQTVEAAARDLEVLLADVTDLAAMTEGALRFNPVTASIRREADTTGNAKLPLTGTRPPQIDVEIEDDVPEFGRFDTVLLRKTIVHYCMVLLAEQQHQDLPRLAMRIALAPREENRLRITLSGRAVPSPTGAAPPAQGSLSTAFVQQAAETMGASATLLRTPDNTLVARIDMPFVAVAEPPDSGAETIYGRLRALVVDDIPTNRFVVVQLLRTLRIEAFEADSGDAAIRMLRTREFDLVLLDMNMPDMDGEATFAEIRNSGEDWAEIPVIALTADAVTYQRDHFIALGMQGYLSKPLERRLLWAEILSSLPPPPPL